MSTLPDFSDPRLPTLVVGHPAIMNFRGEEIDLPEELLGKAMEELECLENEVETTEPSPDFGRDALRRVYAIVDLIGDAVGAGMSCRSGCSACCRVMVATTAGEAALMGEAIDRTPSGQQSVWKRSIGERNALLEELASKNTPPSDLTVFVGLLATCEMYERENQPCPFLGSDKLCGIYAERPLLCRVCWVLTDPVDCEPGQGPPVKFRTRVFEKAHALCGKISLTHFGDARVSPIPYWFRTDEPTGPKSSES